MFVVSLEFGTALVVGDDAEVVGLVELVEVSVVVPVVEVAVEEGVAVPLAVELAGVEIVPSAPRPQIAQSTTPATTAAPAL